MQHIDLICIGKLNAAYFAQGTAEYAKRLSGYCDFKIIELAEETIHEKNASDAAIQKALEKEADKIFANVRKGATIVAMCIEGKLLSSEELAQKIADAAQKGAGDMAFVIGSSHGLSPRVKQAASIKLSMSKMTFPHQLARLMLTEQLYRAFSINNNAKYHK